MNGVVNTSFQSGIKEEQTTVNCITLHNQDDQDREHEADDSDVDSSPYV